MPPATFSPADGALRSAHRHEIFRPTCYVAFAKFCQQSCSHSAACGPRYQQDDLHSTHRYGRRASNAISFVLARLGRPSWSAARTRRTAARSAFSLTFPVAQRDAAGRRCPRSPSLRCSASDLLEVTVSRRPGWLSIWHRGRQASAMPRSSEGGGKGRTSRRGVTERVRAPRNGDPHDAEPFPSFAGSAARPGAAASAAGW